MSFDRNNYYLQNIDEILNRFSKILIFIKNYLSKQIEKEEIQKLIKEFYLTYFKKITEIPYIGGKSNFFSKNIAYTSPVIILWKVFKSNGWSIEQFAPIYLKALKNFTKKEYSGIRGLLKRVMHKILIRKFFLYYIYKRQQKLLEIYPENFILKPLKVGKEFDFGYACVQCPIVEFGRSQGAEEILPYICLYDFYRSYHSLTGLVRSKTLAEGYKYCDYKFKKGSLPKNLQDTQIPKDLKPGV